MSSRFLFISIIVVALATAAVYIFVSQRPPACGPRACLPGSDRPTTDSAMVIAAGSRCGNAPFVFPTTGVVGFIWGDSFRLGHRHQGIDIFAGTEVNVTAVIAAYPGFLTRLPDWKSTVIVRVPDDPLEPGRQIWVYYTHMADPNGASFVSTEFPPGTYEKPVEAGTFLGRQGDYSGDPNNPGRRAPARLDCQGRRRTIHE